MFQSPVSVYWKLLCTFLGTSILLLSFCLAMDSDVGIRHEENEINFVGSGGVMSSGVVGGGGGVAGRGGGG